MDIRKEIIKREDKEYREFHSRLMPTVDKEKIIGVRVPELRKLAKEVDEKTAKDFLKMLPHKFYEEDNLHAFLIERIKDFDECVYELEKFLPFIDNWATCDMLSPKVFKKNTDKLYPYVLKWIESDKPYTVRFGIGMLLKFYLDSEFKKEHLEIVSKIKSEEYYVNMMIAWYFATALAKQYESTVPYIENKKLSLWIHNKTISKARESFRIDKKTKEILKKFIIRQ